MKKKLIGSIMTLALMGALVTTSHAQAATMEAAGPTHDAYTAQAGDSTAGKSPNMPWGVIKAVAAVAGAVVAVGKAVAVLVGVFDTKHHLASVNNGERLFDAT